MRTVKVLLDPLCRFQFKLHCTGVKLRLASSKLKNSLLRRVRFYRRIKESKSRNFSLNASVYCLNEKDEAVQTHFIQIGQGRWMTQ